MFWDFNHKGYLVYPEAWERRFDRRIMWIGAVTLLHNGQSHTITLDSNFFDWPRSARGYAAERAKEIIDAYLSGARDNVDPMRFGSPSVRPVPGYPTGPLTADTVSRFFSN